jgi:hypothetical protein
LASLIGLIGLIGPLSTEEVAEMEVLLVVGGLCALVVLALRYGYDSRDSVRSHEQVMAEFGFDWHGQPGQTRTLPRLVAGPGLRHRLAVILNAVADWIYPVAEAQAPSDTFDRAGHWA